MKSVKTRLNGRHGTFVAGVWYSKRSVFLFIVALINFRKYRSKVLFPKIVMSAFTGFVLYFYRKLSCLMTGSKIWYFCYN